MDSSVWKVFLPHDIFIQSNSFMFGHVSTTDQSIFITASSSASIIPDHLPTGLDLVGTWHAQSKDYLCRQKTPLSPVWVNLSTTEEAAIQCSVLFHREEILSTCVIYNPQELLKSVTLRERSETMNEECDNITAIVKALRRTQALLSDYEVTETLLTYCGPVNKHYRLKQKLGTLLLWLITCLYWPFTWLTSSNIMLHPQSLKTVLTTPCTLVQLGTRSECLQAVSPNNQSPIRKFKNINTCFGQVLDSVLGLCLMYYLMRGNTAQRVADLSLSYGDTVAGELKTLLHWLMGAPAGLKLNSQLTHFLAKFFQYHIYLWTGYLYLLKPVLGSMVFYASMSGVFGLTVQLALFQDIFSTLTLHIYSFYVYAARLYHLQLHALASLWRLFRGKKWNVLRQRVDSAVYDVNQLFVGTLLFTVLLFLLPTTGLYYVVFTVLRLMVLVVQGCVSRLRQLLNTMPVWSLWLWIIRSPSLSDGAVFQITPTSQCHQHSSRFLSMKVSPLSLPDVLALTWERPGTSTGHSWATFLKSLLYGDLIYPWIDRKLKE